MTKEEIFKRIGKKTIDGMECLFFEAPLSDFGIKDNKNNITCVVAVVAIVDNIKLKTIKEEMYQAIIIKVAKIK